MKEVDGGGGVTTGYHATSAVIENMKRVKAGFDRERKPGGGSVEKSAAGKDLVQRG